MILEAVLCVSKKRGLEWTQPSSICKQNACIMSFDEFYNNYVLDVVPLVLVDGAMFLQASLHGLKRNAGGVGGGGRSPPHLQTQRFYHES